MLLLVFACFTEHGSGTGVSMSNWYNCGIFSHGLGMQKCVFSSLLGLPTLQESLLN